MSELIAVVLADKFAEKKLTTGEIVKIASEHPLLVESDIDSDKCTKDYYTFIDSSVLCVDWVNSIVTC